MRKVVILTPEFYPKTNWGGIATFHTTLIAHLLRLGKNVEIVTNSFSIDSVKTVRVHKQLNVTFVPFKTPFKIVDILYFRVGYFLRVVLSKLFPLTLQNFEWSLIVALHLRKMEIASIEAIHTSLYHSAGVISSFLFKKTPFFFHVHGPLAIFLPYEKKTLDKILTAAFQLLPTINSKHIFIPCSPPFGDWLQEKYKLSQVINIPNTLLSKSVPASTTIHTNLLVYWGQIEYRKGVDLLVDAFCMYKKQFPNAHLVIIGKMGASFGSDHTQSFKTWLEEKRLPIILRNSIHIFKPIPHISVLENILKGRKIISVFPSRIEPFGFSILESLSSGHLTVTTTTWGGKMLIKNEKNGFLCEPNKTSLYESLRAVSQRKYSELKAISQAAIIQSTLYTFPKTNAKYKKLYSTHVNLYETI